MYVCMFLCMCVCISVCMYVFVYVCIYLLHVPLQSNTTCTCSDLSLTVTFTIYTLFDIYVLLFPLGLIVSLSITIALMN
jgi:hypothetical protein